MKIQGTVLEHIPRMQNGNVHQAVEVHHHGLGAVQLPDHAYPGIPSPYGVFLHIRPVGVQQLPDAQAADEILRFPPHHAALLHQGLQQLQSLRQAPPVHQAPGFRQGFRTARPEGIVLPVRKNSLGAAGRRQKAKEDPCA